MVGEGEVLDGVGERVEVGGDRGTILWVGEVEGTEGEWLGIEWDREGRGKHDGCHKGSTYFQPVRLVCFVDYLVKGIFV